MPAVLHALGAAAAAVAAGPAVAADEASGEAIIGWASSINWPWIWTLTLLVVDNVIRIGALFVVPRNRRPTSGMAWLLAIFLFPVPGLLLFLIIGSPHPPRARRKKQAAINQLVAKISQEEERELVTPESQLQHGLDTAVALGRSLGAQPMLSGNTASICIDYEESIARMAQAIREARDYVHIEFYLLALDDTTADFFEAIREATARGVVVRVLLDYITSVRYPGTKRTARALTAAGAQWSYMLPVRPWRGQYQRPDLRNHRKLLVADGTVGFMGSQNLIDSSYNKPANRRRGLHWKDLMVRVEGPVVLGLEAVFQGDWYLETDELLTNLLESEIETRRPGDLDCQIVPSGPGFAGENNLQVFVALMYTARRRISITSPYFVPDGSIMNAIRAATARGVDVELFVSEIGDQPVVYHAQRSYYEELLRAGVRIMMFRPPYILHSKHFTVDDAVAVVGSSNMDQRSFNLNMEVSMVVHGESFVEELDGVNDYYRRNSRELTLEEWEKQPLRSQLLDGLARLTSALQ
ncbi:cardiolipin synthase [Leucobacter sp. CSA1]|uniref:Cardiolipin synthase n=1 Tax=Leucobacter chromiisoli TaxID=2796471 RepID=A0A934Q8K2_9MICO|nr:cardiolipin synthase [Leucobacter chromiisoli]MBK0420224.1 cardiolipin synthase [Leucobacter chromiisoli]